jgi:uncharacterized repeat protein (TIGR01451 family)
VKLPRRINRNGSYTFLINAVAPKTSGTYAFDWQMADASGQRFGSECTESITVAKSDVGSGLLEASLATPKIVGDTVPSYVGRVTMLSVDLAASCKKDVTIDGITVTRSTSGDPFQSVIASIDGERVSQLRTFDGSQASLRFTKPITIDACDSVTVDIIASLRENATGSIGKLSIALPSDISATPSSVKGSFPLSGPEFRAAAVKGGLLTISYPSLPSKSIADGTKGAVVGKLKIAVDGVQDQSLYSVQLKQEGTMTDGMLRNIILRRGGTAVTGIAEEFENGSVFLDFDPPYTILERDSVTFDVVADVSGASGKTASISVAQPTPDLFAVGSLYGYGVNGQLYGSPAGSVGAPESVTIGGGVTTDSCALPGTSQLDLATDGTYFYVVAWDANQTESIYKIDAQCHVLDQYRLPGNGGMFGLSYADGYFWTTSAGSKGQLLQLDKNMQIVRTFELPYGAPEGIEYSNGLVWTVYNTATDEITATQVKSGVTQFKFNAPTNAPYGLTVANGRLWVGGTGVIYGIDPATGKVTDTLTSPSKGGYISGLVAYGNSLFIVDNYDHRLFSMKLPIDSTVGARCGNGLLEVNEQCDDGNLVNGDGCSSSCTKEPSYSCSDLSKTASYYFDVCRKGGFDDVCFGQSGNYKGCGYSGQNFCTLNNDTAATNIRCSLGSSMPVCGNGKIEKGEQCDDGNRLDHDGCNSSCTLESDVSVSLQTNGTVVPGGTVSMTITAKNAGPGDATLVHTSNDLPSSFSVLSSSPSGACSQSNDFSPPRYACSFGTLRPGEQKSVTITFSVASNAICAFSVPIKATLFVFEDRNTSNNTTTTYFPMTCSPSCSDKSLQGANNAFACVNKGCYYDERAATQPNTQTCFTERLSCLDEVDPYDNQYVKGTVWGYQSNALSGRGRLASYDYCVGNTLQQVSCGMNQFVQYRSMTCAQGCSDGVCLQLPVCGNGKVEGSESCDDANRMNGDGCSSTCAVEAGWQCNNNTPSICTPVTPARAASIIDAHADRKAMNSTYDTVNFTATVRNDGNTTIQRISNLGVKCKPTAEYAFGFAASNGVDKSIAPGQTADGYINGSYLIAPGKPLETTCTFAGNVGGVSARSFTMAFGIPALGGVCGNGKVEGTEQCDDGNFVNADGCSSDCRIEYAIKVLSPNGGETWQEGQTYAIRWNSIGGSHRVNITAMSDSRDVSIVSNVNSPDGDQVYFWTIPKGFLTQLGVTSGSTPMIIRIKDSVYPKPVDDSDRSFTVIGSIVPPPPLPGLNELSIAVKSIVSTDTANTNQKNIGLIAFEGRATDEDILLTNVVFDAAAGSLLNAQNYTLWVDTDGNGSVDTIVQKGVAAQGGLVTFSQLVGGGFVLPRYGKTVRFEVHADVASSLASTTLQLRFASSQAKFVAAQRLVNGASLSGIRTDGSCAGSCEMSVTTTPSTLWNFVKSGNLYITKSTTPYRVRQLLGGETADPVFGISLRAQGEAIDVTLLTFLNSSISNSIDRLDLYKEGATTPFASATVSACGSGYGQNAYCARMQSQQLVIQKDEQVNVLVRPRIKTDSDGGRSGDLVELSLIDLFGTDDVLARGMSSSNILAANNGNSVADGEIFIGVATPGPNSPITVKPSKVVMSKVVTITNASPDANGSAIPTGTSRAIGQFKFSAAANQNAQNGINKVAITDAIFSVSASNVAFGTGSFKFSNKSDPTMKSSCYVLDSSITQPNFLIACWDIRTAGVNTEIDSGSDATFVLEADILNGKVDNSRPSTLQVSLQKFSDPTLTGMASGLSHIHWLDKDVGSSQEFWWIDSPVSTVNGTAYAN